MMTKNVICGGDCGKCKWCMTTPTNKACERTFEPVSEAEVKAEPPEDKPKKHFCPVCNNQGTLYKGNKIIPCYKCK